MKHTLASLPTLAVLVLALAPPTALAQSNEDINSILQFNFSNPGARSLGMAGAFTARSDDATAVYSNPAGLVQLSRTEISIEGRGWGQSNRFLAGGDQLDPSSLAGLIYDDSDTETAGLSFLSVFYPSNSGRWVVGGFRHQAVNFETELRSDEASVFTPIGGGFARPLDGVLDLEIDTYGASFAVRVLDSLSLGATVSLSEFGFDSRLELNDSARDVEVGDPVFNPFSLDDPYPGLEEGDPELCCAFGNRGDVIVFRTQRGDDRAVAWTLGAMWQSRATRGGLPFVSLGAVYRRGPTFDFAGSSYIRSHAPFTSPPTTRTYAPIVDNGAGVFDVPDVFGVGVSLRPSRRWVVSLDWARVHYADLTDRFLDLVNREPTIPLGESGPAVDFVLDDGDEWRAGAELVLNPDTQRTPVFLRWGAWHDPNHEMEYVGPDFSQRTVYAPGNDELHVSLGIGAAWRDAQLDVAVDLSDRIDTVSLSAVFFVGRD